ncbi:hypothetical protein ACHAXT_002631 [Thalassiosira profunda]
MKLSLMLGALSLAVAAASKIDGDLMQYLTKSSFGRDRAIDLLINEYTSESSPGGRHQRLDKALEALQFVETDSEPVPIEGHDFLFVGSVGASRNEESLRSHGITHIIDWSKTARCNLFDGIDYLCTTLEHNLENLDEAVDFVESARRSGGRVLSHCWHGKNRSVTLVDAYLMKYQGMTAEEANDLVQRTRPQADPWWGDLENYAAEYLQIQKEEQDGGRWTDGERARHLRGRR